MAGAFAYIIAIVAFVIVLNFVMLFFRLRRDRYRRPSRAAIEEEEAAALREREIWRRIDREQEAAAVRVELRNQTLELYEEVRRRAALREKEAEGLLDPDVGNPDAVCGPQIRNAEYGKRK